MALQISKMAWTEVCLGVFQTTHDLYGLIGMGEKSVVVKNVGKWVIVDIEK
jgi:hypothetical protein